MTGYVRSKSLGLSSNQVSKSLRRVNPVNRSRRREDMVRRQNPVPYYAPYFGNKLHCDQNEKLAMYGCTFFAMFDGCSSNCFLCQRKILTLQVSAVHCCSYHFFFFLR